MARADPEQLRAWRCRPIRSWVLNALPTGKHCSRQAAATSAIRCRIVPIAALPDAGSQFIGTAAYGREAKVGCRPGAGIRTCRSNLSIPVVRIFWNGYFQAAQAGVMGMDIDGDCEGIIGRIRRRDELNLGYRVATNDVGAGNYVLSAWRAGTGGLQSIFTLWMRLGFTS
jgi:hypothetical protein